MDKGIEGSDHVDGALFSRIPSKQRAIDKSALSRVQDVASPENKRQDHLDGALFSRIPSQKNDMKRPTNESLMARHSGGEKETLECTIKPEDLSDTEGDACPDIIPEVNKHVSSGRRTPNISNDSSSGSGSSVYDDSSDAIQGSRVSLSRMVREDSDLVIQQASSSTFYVELHEDSNVNQNLSENNSNGIVDFYIPEPETEETQPTGGSNHARNDRNHTAKEKNTWKGDAYELTRLMQEDGSSTTAHRPVTNRTDGNTSCFNWPLCKKLLKALLIPIISLGIYLWDIGSDIYLAVSYMKSGDLNLFWITLGCIVIPHVMMAIVDVSWVLLDRKKENIRRLILGGLTLGRIVRSVTLMRHIYRVQSLPKVKDDGKQDDESETKHGKTRSWHKDRAREEKRDCFMLDFINAFAESAPQLFVQLYLYYAYDLELTILRVLNLLSSWISIAWTYAAYYRCNREALKGKQDVGFVGFFCFFFMSVLSALAARYVCTTLFLVYFGALIGVICISCHFIIMVLWIFLKERPLLEGTADSPCGRHLYWLFFAYVCNFCFMNLNDTRARKRMTVFYILIYIENTIMAAFALCKMNETGSDKIMHLVILPVGCIIHAVLLVNFYMCLHPQTGLCYHCTIPKMCCYRSADNQS